MKRYKKIFIAIGILIIAAAVFIVSGDKNGEKSSESANSSQAEGSTIVGMWLYEDGTRYRFDSEMTGGMYIEGYCYNFDYILDGDILKIDYSDVEVHDAEYLYSIENGRLKLVGKEGTAGGEYYLELITEE